ncbi:DNA repair protein RecO [Dehalogenimonas lykanthroporepellens BL-DC-9]|nr:DNA repair protein RecO [Dehalogenimonas lykanthroporepellens BL-DC-9]
MSGPRELKTPAIVIRRARLKEADRIITFFTRELGRVSALARGVRKPSSRLAGHLEPLNHTDLTLAMGKALPTIIGSQTLNPHLCLRSSLERTSYALYFAELVARFTPEEEANRRVFDLLAEALDAACDADNLELLARYFEVNLLAALGYQPRLGACLDCGKALKTETNYFANSLGGVLCPQCASRAPVAPVSVNALKVLRFLDDHSLEQSARLILDDGLNREIRQLLGAYLRFLLEKDIRSGSWLHHLEIMRPPGTVNPTDGNC